MARYIHCQSLFECVDAIPVFKPEEIGQTDSLPLDDGTQ